MPTTNRYTYDDRAKRFRDDRAGRFLPLREVARARDQFAKVQKAWVEDLTARVAAGQLTVPAWQAAMSQRVKLVHAAQWMLGTGGINKVTQADRRAIGRIVAKQEQHLSKFAGDLAAGKLTARQVAARSQMYMNAATATHERGKSVGLGMPDLPVYPGDGGTVCRSNCRCGWQIDENESEWLATWTLDESGAESCPDCISLSERYSPLIVPK